MIDSLRGLIRDGRYRLTLHAEQERDADQIALDDIEIAFSGLRVQLIEDYPDDRRGHSTLVLGFTDDGSALHGVWAIHENTAVLITIYRPDPRLWIEYRKRKEGRL